MPPEVVARAMDPFFTTKGVGAGTGLGLSMAFGVAKQSGGTLRLNSIVGNGTSVTFVLPCTASDGSSQPTSEESGDALTDDLSNIRIAVVDDDPDVRHFVTDCLLAHGATCETFEGGEAFLKRLAESPTDLALLDFAMPGLSGAEVARRAKLIDHEVPVIIMTGYADSAALDSILGEIKIIRKPFGVKDLLAAVRSSRR
jgi:CheY-like chemotaxis protein